MTLNKDTNPALSRGGFVALLSLLAVAGLVIGAFSSQLGADDKSGVVVAPEEDSRFDFDLRIPEDAISADDLWQQTLRVMRCLESRSIDTVGPIPTEDGRAVDYSFEAVEGSEEAHFECAKDYMPMVIGFSRAQTPQDQARLMEIRDDLVACVGRAVNSDAADEVKRSLFAARAETVDAASVCARG